MSEPESQEQLSADLSENRPVPSHSIAVEANLLKLPLFALHTKGLRSLDGFECRGRTNRGGQTREFLFRTARSTATMYPGPLSRSAHLAFLSLVTERGLPTQNPITWTWRELCRRMGTSPSGREVQQLKGAIEATAGLTIFSRDAVYLKPDGQPLQTRQATHLYESVVFINEPLPDGGVADTNYLWLSPWYLENLNALFTAPLDHELWRHLDKSSPIASRLYEFLLINFYNGMPQFRINYGKLTQFLPVRPERYLSDAHRQLDPAFQLLQQVRLTDHVHWRERTGEIAQIHFDRGDRLDRLSRGGTRIMPPAASETAELLAVTEVRRPPEGQLVSEFYRLWAGQAPARPRPKELALAKELNARFGRARMKALLPTLIALLKQRWPGAKTFVAVESYVNEAAAQFDQRQQTQKQRELIHRQWRTEEQEALRKAAERKAFDSHWMPIWNQLPAADQEVIRQSVLSAHPAFRHAPGILLTRCLEELSKGFSNLNVADPERGVA